MCVVFKASEVGQWLGLWEDWNVLGADGGRKDVCWWCVGEWLEGDALWRSIWRGPYGELMQQPKIRLKDFVKLSEYIKCSHEQVRLHDGIEMRNRNGVEEENKHVVFVFAFQQHKDLMRQ